MSRLTQLFPSSPRVAGARRLSSRSSRTLASWTSVRPGDPRSSSPRASTKASPNPSRRRPTSAGRSAARATAGRYTSPVLTTTTTTRMDTTARRRTIRPHSRTSGTSRALREGCLSSSFFRSSLSFSGGRPRCAASPAGRRYLLSLLSLITRALIEIVPPSSSTYRTAHQETDLALSLFAALASHLSPLPRTHDRIPFFLKGEEQKNH